MTNILKGAAFFVLLLGILGYNVAGAAKTQSELDIHVLDCVHVASAPGSRRNLELSVLALTNSRKRQRSVAPSTQPDTWNAAIPLPEGRYIIGMNYGDCFGNVLVTLLRGHRRDVAVALEQAVRVPRVEASLAGGLPVYGIRKIALLSQGCDCTVSGVIDGNAYYFDHAPPGNGKLEVYFFGSDAPVIIPVEISAHDELLVRNVRATEVEGGSRSNR